MVDRKRRKIAPKTSPLPPGADDFVKDGGEDPELQEKRSPSTPSAAAPPIQTKIQLPPPASSPPPEETPQPKKRGRPAGGKRSDDAWIGRTFYIKRETDLDIEALLLEFKRNGIEIDKSELVEILLSALVKWHNGENLEIHLSEISPIQK